MASPAYVSGHHASVLRSHKWRTAQNSAEYLLPHLRPDMQLLDAGCGPGTITLDFASLLPQGHVYGVDPSAEVIAQAKDAARERGIVNVTFVVGDVLGLGKTLAGKRFDVVHAHQVLQHVPRQEEAMLAMRSVLKSGGILAVRETQFSAMAWYPRIPELREWLEVWGKVTQSYGGDCDTGSKLLSLGLGCGFPRDQITATASTWCYSTPEERGWWGGMWAERVLKSDFAKKVLERGYGTEIDLKGMSDAWKAWTDAEDGWFAVMHGEIICKL